ncbi:MAG TPA: hypothetical protein VFP15_14270, partial [Gemmatimonadaceae bacterium]|nr:hypothetical protein [Gemmatimonadaceae bacterium]
MSLRQSRRRTFAAALLALSAAAPRAIAAQGMGQLGDVVDAGADFKKPFQPAFVASRLTSF